MSTHTSFRGQEISVLVVEDSPTQAELLRSLLEDHRYVVTVASNGRAALTEMRRHRPHVIISDVVMPGMDGYTFCRSVKADPGLRDVPVILVTTLSDPQDVIRGLECGADNFIRKPYEERYLLSRIEYLLMNRELRRSQRMQMGVEIDLGGRKHFINAERQQILDLLISTYEQAIHINEELKARERDLGRSHQALQSVYRVAEGLNQVTGEQAVVDVAFARMLEFPGVRACWVHVADRHGALRLAALSGLPAAPDDHGERLRTCPAVAQLQSGELQQAINVLRCDCLSALRDGDPVPLYHASVPLRIGDRALGLISLVGPDEGLFDTDALQMLDGIGHQVAVALERSILHERLELLVTQRTAALTGEVRQREAAQAKLLRANQMLEQSQATARVGGWEWDWVEETVYWTDEIYRILDTSPAEHQPTFANRTRFCTSESAAQIESALAQSMQGDGIFDLDIEMITGKGRRIWVHSRGEVSCDEGRPVRCTGVLQDISERLRTEASLKQALADLSERHHELQDFAYVASHDLQEPLRKIRTFSERLLSRFSDGLDAGARDYIDRSARAAERMQALIDDLLAYSRINARGSGFVIAELAPLLTQVIEDLEARLESSGGRVEVGALPTIQCDPSQMRQLFQNLLANALKFRAPDRPPVVRISAEPIDGDGPRQWIIRVEDNGIGFDSRYADRIFAPFQRLHGRQDYEGSGIGLAIVRRIVDRHRGDVRAEGRPGEGACFTVQLPETQPDDGRSAILGASMTGAA